MVHVIWINSTTWFLFTFLHFKVSAQIRQHSGYCWTHKILSSQKFNEYFHRTSRIKLTQVCFLSLPTQKVSAHCTRHTTLYLHSISYYMQYSTWTSVFSVLKTSCIWSLKPRDNISSASSKTNNLMLLVPLKKNNKFYYHTQCQTLTTRPRNTSIHIAPNINSTYLTLILENLLTRNYQYQQKLI